MSVDRGIIECPFSEYFLAIFANLCHYGFGGVYMATMNVSLPDPMKHWVEARAKTGRYSNASDYVRDLIRRDQAQAARIAEMQRLVTEGLESGVDDQSMADVLKESRLRAVKA
jgi:antitoxin ParD1/3/4